MVLVTMKIPQLQFLNEVIDVFVVQVVQGSLFLTVTCTVFGVRLKSTRYGFSGR